MERVYVQRHAIDKKPFREVTSILNAKLVKYFEGSPPAGRRDLDWAASTGWNALMSNSLFAPEHREMWTAARACAQGRAGTFAAGTAASARVSVPFGDKMVEIDRLPEFVNALPTYWLEGFCCAALAREAVCLELLAQVPDEIFRDSRATSADSHEPWRGALITYYKGRDPTKLVERALFLSEPAQLTALTRPDVAKLWIAQYRMMLPLFRKDAEAFNRALVDALEAHKKFYGKKSEGQREGSFLAAGPAALCALAHDAGLPIEVESEYLPMTLIQGGREGSSTKGSASATKPAKSATKPAAKSSAKPAVKAAKSPAKSSKKSPAKASRGRR